jgi:hypothetical protein
MRTELEGVPMTDAQWLDVIERCGSLFIYASAVCRYIRRRYNRNSDALEEAVSAICNSTGIPVQLEPIDELYYVVLLKTFDQSEVSDVELGRTKAIIDIVICGIEPMTLDVIAGLLNLTSGRVFGLMEPLRSLINISEATGLVTALHPSFSDFVLSPERSGRFHRDTKVQHVTMATQCLGVIESAEPKINICALPSSYLFDDEVQNLDERVSTSISPGLLYACRFWSAHLELGQYQNELVGHVGNFFSSRLLLWMEVINLTNHMRDGTKIIQVAEEWCTVSYAYRLILSARVNFYLEAKSTRRFNQARK